jgi:hypothetical protein
MQLNFNKILIKKDFFSGMPMLFFSMLPEPQDHFVLAL